MLWKFVGVILLWDHSYKWSISKHRILLILREVSQKMLTVCIFIRRYAVVTYSRIQYILRDIFPVMVSQFNFDIAISKSPTLFSQLAVPFLNVEMALQYITLTLRPLLTTVGPYANSLDPDETPSNSASHPDPSCLTLRQYFHQFWVTLNHFENESRRKI